MSEFPEGIENDVELPEEFCEKGDEEMNEDGAGNSGDEAEYQPEDGKKKSLTSRQKAGNKHNHSIINVASLRNQKAQKTPQTSSQRCTSRLKTP